MSSAFLDQGQVSKWFTFVVLKNSMVDLPWFLLPHSGSVLLKKKKKKKKNTALLGSQGVSST